LNYELPCSPGKKNFGGGFVTFQVEPLFYVSGSRPMSSITPDKQGWQVFATNQSTRVINYYVVAICAYAP
jgi:hypothetical protein